LQPDVFEWYRILDVRPGASADEIKVWSLDRLQDESPRLRHKAEE
jgi:hypothetical protein